MARVDLTNVHHIKALKEAYSKIFSTKDGQVLMEFLEEFCGEWSGGPANAEDLSNNMLQYERGKRDVFLTLKTIGSPEWTPEDIVNQYKRMEK